MTIAEPMVRETLGSFTDYSLSANTLRAITSMGIETPTPIQAEAIPTLLAGHDVIGQARTGSGKTLAFGIPALEVVDVAQKGVQVLVLTPTRELAVQVAGVLEELGANRGIKVGLLFGGRAEGPQRLMLKRGVHVIVGTPGRVLDMLNQAALWLDKVRFLVLDEADEMLDRGFAPDVERILARTTSARQTALFSATVPEWVQKTAERHLNEPVQVAVDPNPEDAAPIEHVAYDLGAADKVAALKDLLDHRGDGSIIVFGRTKHGVKKLAKQLEMAGYPVAALQGNLSQNARDDVMASFRSGQVKILLATNVAARGLDITSVEQVINFELPESPQLLTHRVGRTGRMGRPGKAITLLSHDDASKWRQLEKGLGQRIPRANWPGAWEALNGDVPELGAQPVHERTRDAQPQRSRNGNVSVGAVTAKPSGSSEHRQHRTHERAVKPHAVPAQMRTAAPPRPERPSYRYGSVSTPGQRSDRPRPERNGNQRAPMTANRQQFAVECAACGAATTVPFEPTSGRPVYCRMCYQAMRGE